MALLFNGLTVLITGVRHGVGRHLAEHLAAVGANLVLHDHTDETFSDQLASKIQATGGSVISERADLEHLEKLVAVAISRFGRLDILINNAAPVVTTSWFATRQDHLDSIIHNDFKLSFKVVQAAWLHFKERKTGRFITTCSTHPNGRTALESIALYGQLGLIQTIALEGAKYNVLACVVEVADRMPTVDASTTAPNDVSASIATLSHPRNLRETGHLYSVRNGRLQKVRWERALGASLNPEHSLTAGGILSQWRGINDFSQPLYPKGSADFPAVLARTKQLDGHRVQEEVRLDEKVALVTGASSGLGRAYALHFGRLGAHVLLNDLSDPSAVVDEIRSEGGSAHSILGSVSDGDRIAADALAIHGSVDIIVNNAGFVRDKSIAKMTDDRWDSVVDVHLNGMFKVIKALWPQMQKRRYGRIVNITSTSGIYGSFGQSNYSLAKCAVIGLSQALAKEGVPYNIFVNAVAPVASTPALAVALEGSATDIRAEFCAPFVALLCSDDVPSEPTGRIYEIGAGWHAQTRQQASHGIGLDGMSDITSKELPARLIQLSYFDTLATSYPEQRAIAESHVDLRRRGNQRLGKM